MKTVGIFINDQLAFECDRSIELDDAQLEFLDKMDQDMDRGIKVYGELIRNPDIKQKATFVAMNLLKALQQQDDGKISVSCAYVNQRLPHVIEVHARDQDNRIDIEFVEEH